MNRTLGMFVIGLVFGGGIGFTIAASTNSAFEPHDHGNPAHHLSGTSIDVGQAHGEHNHEMRMVVSSDAAQAKQQYEEFQNALRKVHDYIDKHYEDVGHQFADQALKMHSGDLEPRNIRGVVSKDDAKSLKEKGVSALPIPEKPVDKDKLN